MHVLRRLFAIVQVHCTVDLVERYAALVGHDCRDDCLGTEGGVVALGGAEYVKARPHLEARKSRADIALHAIGERIVKLAKKPPKTNGVSLCSGGIWTIGTKDEAARLFQMRTYS